MKQIINISISTIIFHIEKDAYSKLRKYLDEIYAHFSSYKNGSEIITDIESRIAEILLAKRKGKESVVTLNQVSDVMHTIGDINDLKQEEKKHYDPNESKKNTKSKYDFFGKGRRFERLYRNEREKKLGGICAGIGNYVDIDPVWVRLACILLLFSSFGIICIVYAILWVVLPAQQDTEQQTRKMFRNTDQKILGGVASGVAVFLNTEIVLIRLLFIGFTLVGGSGAIVYLILWIITPTSKFAPVAHSL